MLSLALLKIISTKSKTPFLGHHSLISRQTMRICVCCILSWTKIIVSWCESGQGANKVDNQQFTESMAFPHSFPTPTSPVPYTAFRGDPLKSMFCFSLLKLCPIKCTVKPNFLEWLIRPRPNVWLHHSCCAGWDEGPKKMKDLHDSSEDGEKQMGRGQANGTCSWIEFGEWGKSGIKDVTLEFWLEQ